MESERVLGPNPVWIGQKHVQVPHLQGTQFVRRNEERSRSSASNLQRHASRRWREVAGAVVRSPVRARSDRHGPSGSVSISPSGYGCHTRRVQLVGGVCLSSAQKTQVFRARITGESARWFKRAVSTGRSLSRSLSEAQAWMRPAPAVKWPPGGRTPRASPRAYHFRITGQEGMSRSGSSSFRRTYFSRPFHPSPEARRKCRKTQRQNIPRPHRSYPS